MDCSLIIIILLRHHGTGLMLGMGGATWFSIFKNQGAKRRKDQVFSHTVVLSCCFALMFVLAGFTASRGLTALLGADKVVLQTKKPVHKKRTFGYETHPGKFLIYFDEIYGDQEQKFLEEDGR